MATLASLLVPGVVGTYTLFEATEVSIAVTQPGSTSPHILIEHTIRHRGLYSRHSIAGLSTPAKRAYGFQLFVEARVASRVASPGTIVTRVSVLGLLGGH